MVDHLHSNIELLIHFNFCLKGEDVFSWCSPAFKLFLPLHCRFYSDFLHLLACNAQAVLLHWDPRQLWWVHRDNISSASRNGNGVYWGDSFLKNAFHCRGECIQSLTFNFSMKNRGRTWHMALFLQSDTHLMYFPSPITATSVTAA